MARPIAFERGQALDAAMRLFWIRGYAASSLECLTEAMGISRSSLYASFGGKRQLFREALQLFSIRTRKIFEREWCEERPLDTLPRFFCATILEVPRRRAARGCLLVNSVLELRDVEADLNEVAATELGRVEKVFEDCFSAAQERHQYSRQHSPRALAAQLMLLNQGLRVRCRAPGALEEIRSEIDVALSLIALPALDSTHGVPPRAP
ncbi:MAG: TetR family transcriptional regulator [Myxococcota bacterium]|nr:TetR family transcriptional regulator [Myxococcota bacterium]